MRSTLTSILLVAISFFMGVDVALATEVSFSASVDRTQIEVGERFTLSFVLENAGMGGGEGLKLPDLSDFFILSGPNQSSSIQFVNGHMSSSVTYGYVLQPKKVGNYTIGSASIDVDGKDYTSKPIQVEVLQTRPAPRQPDTGSETGEGIEDKVFLKAFIDKKRVVQGEQVTLTYKVYTRLPINNYAINKAPSLTGFWNEEISSGDIIDVTTEVIDGREFTTGVIQQIALFPTQSGELEIDPLEVQVLLQVRKKQRRDPFESFFRDPFDSFLKDPFGQTVKYIIQSNPLTVIVSSLPGSAPDSFKGAVGAFRMDVSLDKSKVKIDEPVNLKIRLSGKGNIKLLEAPEVDLPAGLESYPPKVTDEINQADNLISGVKTFEYLLIPRSPGKSRIGSIVYSYFDPSKDEYVTLESRAYDIDVEPSALTASTRPAGVGRSDVQLLSQDIRFIKLSDLDLERRGEYLFNRPFFIVLIVLPFLGFIGVLTYGKRVQRSKSDIAAFRRRRALRKAQKGLKRVRHAMQGSRTEEFYRLLSQVVWRYIGDMLNIDPGSYSLERTIATLTEREVSPDVIRTLQDVLDSCAMATYSPGSSDVTAMGIIFGKGKEILSGLERELR